MDRFGFYISNFHIFEDSNLAHVQEVLISGANPNERIYGGVSTFHHAISFASDNIKVIEELMKAGADVNARTHLDYTPLHFAVCYRKYRVVKALIQSGASVNAKDFLGKTSLHYAVSPLLVTVLYIIQYYPDPVLVHDLLQHEDIDCNVRDTNGDTPLMLAVKYREMRIVTQLLQRNADPNICNNAFETPLHAAFSQPPNYNEIYLLRRGASIYSVDRNGQTPVDILLKSDLTLRPWDWIISILKIIAFNYNITSDLKKKFEILPQLSDYFNKFCNEVDHMKRDFISGNITMHDFCLGCVNLKDFNYEVKQMRKDCVTGKLTMPSFSWDCCNENDLYYHHIQIYEPVVERLVKHLYPEFFFEIFQRIPKFYLISKLELSARRKKHTEAKEKVKSLVDLFSLLDIIYLFSKYLSTVDFFSLIVAFSDVNNVKSMQILHARNCVYFFDCN